MKIIFFYIADFAMYCTAWVVLKLTSIVVKLFHEESSDKRMKVLVLANQAIGDTIIKVPFFFALRKEFPPNRYRVTAVLSLRMASALSKLNCFDEVLAEAMPPYRHALFWIFDRRGFAAKPLRWAFQNKVEVFIACDRYRDLGIDFVHSLCRPTLSFAYDTSMVSSIFPVSAKFQRMFYDKGYSQLLKPSLGVHQIEDTFSFLSLAVGRKIEPLSVDSAVLAPMLDLSVVEKYGLRVGEYSVLVPGAAAAYRRWPTERFAEIAKFVGGVAVVVGSQEESVLAKEIFAKSGLPIVDLCGKTNICQLLGVVAKAGVVISNETGAANCAAILGVKTVCILGGGDFGSFFPNKFCINTASVYHKESCFGCGWKCKRLQLCTNQVAPCINSISVGDVVNAICFLKPR